MHGAVDLLEAARDATPAERLAVCQRAIASAVTVILKADDSSGVIGAAVRRPPPAEPAPGLDVDAFIAQLRETHRRRPRLLLEFDRAHLP